MKHLDRLMKKARELGRRWMPDMFILTGEQGAYTLTIQEWDGMRGSARDADRRKSYGFTTKDAAKQFAAAVVRAYIDRAKGWHFQPHLLDCSMQTDEERRAAWLESGGTVLERMAEAEGVRLEDKVLEGYGTVAPVWADILRWRKEVGIDGEEAVAPFHAAGGAGVVGKADE